MIKEKTGLESYISNIRETIHLEHSSDESHLNQLRAFNAVLRTSLDRFRSLLIWRGWEVAIKETIQRLKSLLDCEHPQRDSEIKHELHILNQLFQISRNLCAGGSHHQQRLS